MFNDDTLEAAMLNAAQSDRRMIANTERAPVFDRSRGASISYLDRSAQRTHYGSK